MDLEITIRHADGSEERRSVPDTPEARRTVDRAAWHMLAQDDVREISVEYEERK